MGLWNYLSWSRGDASRAWPASSAEPPVEASGPSTLPEPSISSRDTLTLKRFDPSCLETTDRILILGRRRAGKTSLLEDLLRNMSVPLEHVIDVDENGQGNLQERLESASKDKDNEKMMVLFPPTSDRTFGAALEGLNYGGFKVGIIKECTHPLGLPPCLRDLFDYTFIFPDSSREHLRKTWENYADAVPTFSGFRTLVESLGRFQCIVIDRKKPGAIPWNERVYYYEASQPL